MFEHSLPSTKTCKCHNIQFSGTKAERLYKTGLSIALQQKAGANKQSLYQVRAGSVEINDFAAIDVNKFGESHCTITCQNCGMILNLFYGRGNAFAQFSTNTLGINPRAFGDSYSYGNENETLKNIPLVLRSLVKGKPVDVTITPEYNEEDFSFEPIASFEKQSAEDEDFDLMFSSTTAPIVGSYTESPMSFTEAIFA